jgi:hypothetical protein
MMDETFTASAGDIAVEGVDYEAEIARSDTALVYRGRQAAEQRTVVVKVLGMTGVPAGALDDATSLPTHPHLVKVHATGVNAAGHPYVVMDHLAGGSMAERIASDGPLPWSEALRAGAQLATALETAHKARLLHLGIKPSNVMLSEQGDVSLSDFVITELHRRTSATSSVSFAYVAPEVLGGANPSRTSDIFSLGGTIFAMVPGHPPTHLAEAAVAGLRRLQVPEAPAQVLGRALAEDPAGRPASALAFGRALREVAVPASGAGPAPSGSPGRPYREAAAPDEDEDARPPAGGPRRELAWAVALAMVVAAIVAFVVLRQPSAQDDMDQAGDQLTDQAGDQAVDLTPGQGAVAVAAVADLAPFGVEGVAVAGAEVAVSGVEVRSVASPSPAEESGIVAGDLITKIAGVALAGDSLSDYDELVRGRDPEAPLAVQVLRSAEGTLYEGELDGEALVPVVDRSLLADLPPGDSPYDDSVRIVDETGALEVTVPAAWTETDVEAFVGLGPNVQAAPDLAEFREAWGSPGINLTATTERDVDDLEGILAAFVEPGGLADCTTEGPQPYFDGAFRGVVQYFTDCGGTASGFAQVVATPADGAFVLQLGLQMVDQDDLAALDTALASVYVPGPL